MSKTALVVLAPGFEEIEAITPVDVLRRAGLTVTMAGLVPDQVTGAHGIPLQTDTTVEAVTNMPDAIVLPGGMPGSKNLGESKATKDLVCKVAENGGLCAAICAAPAFTLAPWGLLEGKTATCYPGFEKDFPHGTEASEAAVVRDGNIITSRGPGTALPFALALVEALVDKETADQLQRGMLIQMPCPS